jgi:uncharacterized protein (DUF4415 family)
VQKEEHIVRATANELSERAARGETRTDWKRVDAMTDQEIEANIDEDDEGQFDLSQAFRGLPQGVGVSKQQLTVRFDTDVIDFFKSQGKGYQTRMNAVLRQFMEHEKGRTG